MRPAFRRFLLDPDETLYCLSNAAFDLMLSDPTVSPDLPASSLID